MFTAEDSDVAGLTVGADSFEPAYAQDRPWTERAHSFAADDSITELHLEADRTAEVFEPEQPEQLELTAELTTQEVFDPAKHAGARLAADEVVSSVNLTPLLARAEEVTKQTPPARKNRPAPPVKRKASGKRERVRVNRLDIKALRFLERFGYARPDQIARLTGRALSTEERRLRQMLRAEPALVGAETWNGWVHYRISPEGQKAEFRGADNSVIGVNGSLPLSRMTSLQQHSSAVIDLALDAIDGGEVVASERQIKQGVNRWKADRRPQAERQNDYGNYFAVTRSDLRGRVWEAAQLDSAPETSDAAYFATYANGENGEHYPDFVIIRDRENGQTRSVAVEVERSDKSPAEWKKKLRSFRDNGEMYGELRFVLLTDTPDYARMRRKLIEAIREMAAITDEGAHLRGGALSITLIDYTPQPPLNADRARAAKS